MYVLFIELQFHYLSRKEFLHFTNVSIIALGLGYREIILQRASDLLYLLVDVAIGSSLGYQV